MTTKEKFIDLLCQRYIMPDTAAKIVEQSIPITDRVWKYIKITHRIDWNGQAAGYPHHIYAIIWEMVIRKMALKWINKNVPEAFYKQLFEN